MKDIYIPEVLEHQPRELKINLKKIDNNQVYNYNTTNTTNNTTINNNTKKSFFLSLIKFIFFPITFIYYLIKNIIIKYQIKEQYDNYKIKTKIHERNIKNLNRYKKAYFKDDEIY